MPDGAVTEIQCPTCSKRFRLPANPPAVFACTGCGTPMDLSAFRTAPAAPAAAAGGGGRPSGAHRSGRSAGAAAARMRHRRAEEAGEEDEGGRRGPPPKKDNANMAIVWSLIGLVVIGGIALIASKRSKPSTPAEPDKTTAGANGGPGASPSAPAAPTPAPGTGPAAPSGAGGGSSTPPAGTPSGSGEPAMSDAPKAPPAAKGTLHEVGHHPEASDDEKAQIDKLIQTAVFESAGADSRDAEKQLVAIGMKAAPRLINVFYTVKQSEGFEERLGKMKAAIADRILRKIDGYQERKRKSMSAIVAASDPKFVESSAKSWMLWWDNELWKNPMKPWDPREANEGEGGGGGAGGGGTPDGGK